MLMGEMHKQPDPKEKRSFLRAEKKSFTADTRTHVRRPNNAKNI